MAEQLTNAQAQAVADILILHADEYFDLVEKALELFPDVDWIGLCLPSWVDPRPLPPRKPRTAKEAREQRTRWDESLREYAETIRQELAKPSFL